MSTDSLNQQSGSRNMSVDGPVSIRPRPLPPIQEGAQASQATPCHVTPHLITPRRALSCPGVVLSEDVVIGLAADAATITGGHRSSETARPTGGMKATFIGELAQGNMCSQGRYLCGANVML